LVEVITSSLAIVMVVKTLAHGDKQTPDRDHRDGTSKAPSSSALSADFLSRLGVVPVQPKKGSCASVRPGLGSEPVPRSCVAAWVDNAFELRSNHYYFGPDPHEFKERSTLGIERYLGDHLDPPVEQVPELAGRKGPAGSLQGGGVVH
jgi:hypothetical protein